MSTSPLYLSRATLRRDVSAAALRALLVPASESGRAGAGHRVVWTLFADTAERERDFLWREADAGVYYLLSSRLPEDRHGLFEVEPPKLFAPAFDVGDRVHFSLRANATVARKATGDKGRGKPCDVVMDVLHRMPQNARASARHAAASREGVRWLANQGSRCGFAIGELDEEGDGIASSVHVSDYRTLRIDHGGPAARIGVLELEGELEVRDPDLFVSALGKGFGRAKAFGCGLMLVRRA